MSFPKTNINLARVFTRKVYYGYCLPRFRNQIAVIRDAVYTELINQSRLYTKGGLRFSRKASAAMLHINYWKIINFLTPVPNAGPCQFAGGDVDPNL